MTKIKTVLSTMLAATAMIGATLAQAADISHAPQTLVLENGVNYFGAVFDDGASGDTFADRYSFTTTATSSFAALASSISQSASDGIQITNFQIFNSGGFSIPGTKVLDGQVDLWTFTSGHAVADAYYFLVSGTLLSDGAAAYSGNVSVATAVPEPEIYGMLLAGLGVAGWMARRRKNGVGAA